MKALLLKAAEALHQRIMNLPVSEKVKAELDGSPKGFYLLGHRDARHAAAELACSAIADLEAAIREQPGEATPDEHLRLVWNTLMFFAHPDSYTQGERTGGVLAGCPRSEPPSPDVMAGYAQMALAELRRHVGIEPDAWMLDGSHAPQQRLRLTEPEERALHRTEVVRDALLAYHDRPCDTEAAAVIRAVASQFTELIAVAAVAPLKDEGEARHG